MDLVVEELQLLGFLERGKENEIIPRLLDLYHRTLEERNNIQAICTELASEIRSLQDRNRCLHSEYAEQGAFISKLQKELLCVSEQMKATSHQLSQLRKETLMERKQAEQWAREQKVSMQKACQQIRCLKEELRRKTAISSKRPQESFVDVGCLRIRNNHLSVDAENFERGVAEKEDILAKGIRRLDRTQRLLLEESTSIWTSIQMINMSVQQAVVALRLHIFQDELDSENIDENEEFGENMQWVPQLIQNTHNRCVQLNKLVAVLQKTFPPDKIAVENGAVFRYLQCFNSFEESLEKAHHVICNTTE